MIRCPNSGPAANATKPVAAPQKQKPEQPTNPNVHPRRAVSGKLDEKCNAQMTTCLTKTEQEVTVYTDMEQWAEIRRRVLNGEISKRGDCAEYEIHWNTLKKILTHTEPPGYRLTKTRVLKIDPFLPTIIEYLESDKKTHRKQRHTTRKIFERLQKEHGFTGGITIVQDAVRELKHKSREVFLPLSHPPGEAQVDFGFADVLLNGKLTKVALFVMTMPYSDAIFMQAFPRECTESFLEGHKRAFEFFGGVPNRISYDNSRIAVARITGFSRKKSNDRVFPTEKSFFVRGSLLLSQTSQ